MKEVDYDGVCCICGTSGCSYTKHHRHGVKDMEVPMPKEVDDTLDVVQFKSAKRSKVAPCYHLIDRGYMRRQTNNLEFGWHKYTPDGTGTRASSDGNWRGAVDALDVPFLIDVLNHLEEHIGSLTETTLAMLEALRNGQPFDMNKNEDDIAHASFNLMILSRLFDHAGFTAQYWRPIYQERLRRFLESKDAERKASGV